MASTSWFSFLQFCRKYKQHTMQKKHTTMTITITQGHLHTRELCRKTQGCGNSAEDTNSQSHKQPMTITTHSAGAISQSSKCAKNTTQRPLTYITKKQKTTQVDHSTIYLSSYQSLIFLQKSNCFIKYRLGVSLDMFKIKFISSIPNSRAITAHLSNSCRESLSINQRNNMKIS